MRCYLSKVAVFHLFTITILWGDKGVGAEFGGYLRWVWTGCCCCPVHGCALGR